MHYRTLIKECYLLPLLLYEINKTRLAILFNADFVPIISKGLDFTWDRLRYVAIYLYYLDSYYLTS